MFLPHKNSIFQILQQANHCIFLQQLIIQIINPMTKQSTQSILIPAKFISLILHLIIVTMSYFSYPDNIIAAYPSLTKYTETQYVGGRVSFLACNTLTVIFIVVELIVLFVGVNMFRERINFINATLHFLGTILWASYSFQQWQFSQIWAIWAVCSLLPVVLEIITIISVANK